MKVLLATDGKSPAARAQRLLAGIGDRDRIEITVMSVAGFDTALQEGDRTEGRYSPEAGRKHALAVIDRAVEELIASGFRASGHLTGGYPPLDILHEIERGWHELTVLGAGSASWIGQILLGSVSTKVLHASPTSVLIVHESSTDDGGQVLLGSDGSRGAEFALRTLVGFADPGRVRVRVTSVVKPGEGIAVMPEQLSPQVVTDQQRNESHQQAESQVSHAMRALEDAGFQCEGDVRFGHPAEQILEQAEADGSDVVVIGSRGLGSVQRAVLGSVSDQVARHARAALVGRRFAMVGGDDL
ncbi:MAG: universal stress protein [Actinomycetota bacterium]